MATPTYTPIASMTLGSSASSVTFSSIPQDYRDLVLVVNGRYDGNYTVVNATFNNDTGSNYSQVRMFGTPSSTFSDTNPEGTNTFFFGGDIATSTEIMQVMDYSATDKHKTVINRSSQPDSSVNANAVRYASVSAITSIQISGESRDYQSGTTLALYGIEA